MTVDGVIRVWGTAQVALLMRQWDLGFRKSYPRVHVESRLTGSDVGVAGLYTGFAELAVLSRECTAFERKAFEWIFRYPPAQIQIMTGSLDRGGQAPALVAYVHRDNPLVQVTLVQLDAIFGCERLGGGPKSIRTWGDLGLSGEWADKSIHLYADDTESGTGRYFRHAVLGDSARMNWEHFTEFKGLDARHSILTALAADPVGLAVTGGSSEFAPQVKVLALACDCGHEAVTPSLESLISRSYPLTRAVYACFNRRPETPLDTRLKAFLRYILSDAGQEEVVQSKDYLPLSPQMRREQLQMLE